MPIGDAMVGVKIGWPMEIGIEISRQETLDLLMLLSALESWALSRDGSCLPDYLHERMDNAIKMLSEGLVGNES